MFISPIRNTLPFPRCSMAKTYSDNDTSPCQCPGREHEGSVSSWGIDSLDPLHLQLCFSWSAFLLSPAQRFVPHPTSSLCTEELLLRPKLKWLMKLWHFPLHWVIWCHKEWSANMGPGMLLLVALLWASSGQRGGWQPGGSRCCLRNSGQLCLFLVDGEAEELSP